MKLKVLLGKFLLDGLVLISSLFFRDSHHFIVGLYEFLIPFLFPNIPVFGKENRIDFMCLYVMICLRYDMFMLWYVYV